MEVILTPDKYYSLKHFSDLRIPSIEAFVNRNLLDKGLQRRKNLKEALITIIKVSYAYSKMKYEKIGISSSTFQNLILCSKQTVFNVLNDIRTHFNNLIKIEKKLDATGRFRNFFTVDLTQIEQLTDLLTEEEKQQIEDAIKQLQLNITVEDVLSHLKKERKLTYKELKKQIKKMLKQKQQFLAYLRSIAQGTANNTDNLEDKIKQIFNIDAVNPRFLQAVEKLLNTGHTLKDAIAIAKTKYDPQPLM